VPNAKYFLGALELIREVVDEDTAANAMRTTLFILSGDYHDQRQSPGRFPGFFPGWPDDSGRNRARRRRADVREICRVWLAVTVADALITQRSLVQIQPRTQL